MKRYLIAAAIMSAIAGIGAVIPGIGAAFGQALTYADRSGTITLGGTAQTLAPAWPNRHGCAIQNVSAGDLWVNTTATAVVGQPSFKLVPGAQYLCMQPATDGAISIIGATTAQAFAAREW